MKQNEVISLADNPKVTEAKRRFSIIGNSQALLEAVGRAVRVAPIDLSVLVNGESGSGKEFFPKIIHHFGSRKHKKYIAVNCGAIPEGTIDSELFGHEKGSFTGAISDRKGYFEEADGGTIFLDEVAELPMTTQARLLRVLETGEFLKVGSSKVQKTDIRIVAATNVDLPEAVAKGKFREDLYYRLSTIHIVVPNLHDRGDDIMLLARKFANDFSEKYMTPPITFSADARRYMLLYRWPGNVRQLKNVVEQLALFESGREVDRRTLMESLPASSSVDNSLIVRERTHSYETEREMLWQVIAAMKTEMEAMSARIEALSSGQPAAQPSAPATLRHIIGLTDVEEPAVETVPAEAVEAPRDPERDAERETIIDALRRNKGNKSRAAADLGISERTIYRKIKELNIPQKLAKE